MLLPEGDDGVDFRDLSSGKGGADRRHEHEQRRRLFLFVLIWALWVYVFFTMSQTKFHHYIFPAVPPMAVLVGVWFAWLAEDPKARVSRALGFVVLALFAVAARDLLNDPQTLVNLFTYKYDRDYPREISVRPFLGTIVGFGAAGMLLGYLLKQQGRALLAFFLMACLSGAWISHHHFNMLSPHWSQAHLFKTYYGEKKGTEPIYAYQLNWRGETWALMRFWPPDERSASGVALPAMAEPVTLGENTRASPGAKVVRSSVSLIRFSLAPRVS